MIWSSSQASLHNNINLNDIQDAAGLVSLDHCVCACVCVRVRADALTLLWLLFSRRDPYGVSKKTIDLTAIQLNKELSEKVNYYISYMYKQSPFFHV